MKPWTWRCEDNNSRRRSSHLRHLQPQPNPPRRRPKDGFCIFGSGSVLAGGKSFPDARHRCAQARCQSELSVSLISICKAP